MDEWRARTRLSSARLRGYYDVIPDRDSRLTLDGTTNRYGDRLPRIDFKDAPESVDLRDYTHETMRARFEHMARAGDGRLMSTSVSYTMEHPGGGCRMGDDAQSSVTDTYGRTHDHENLFVVGAPTMVSGGCANGTPTFAALSLRSAEEIAKALPSRR